MSLISLTTILRSLTTSLSCIASMLSSCITIVLLGSVLVLVVI